MAAVRSRFEDDAVIEPGRSIAANAGLLLPFEYLKHTEHKNFAIVDGAMNDLLRRSVWCNAEIIPVQAQSACNDLTLSAGM